MSCGEESCGEKRLVSTSLLVLGLHDSDMKHRARFAELVGTGMLKVITLRGVFELGVFGVFCAGGGVMVRWAFDAAGGDICFGAAGEVMGLFGVGLFAGTVMVMLEGGVACATGSGWLVGAVVVSTRVIIGCATTCTRLAGAGGGHTRHSVPIVHLVPSL